MEKLNQVLLTGKISRVGHLKYSPSGLALLEFTLAVEQKAYEKVSIGYFPVVVADRLAEDLKGKLKIGMPLSIKGSLYQRMYSDRSGGKVDEIKIVLENLEEQK